MNPPPELQPGDEWLTTKAAAHYLGLSKHTLKVWRYKRRGPTYYKWPGRAGRILYKRSDLDDFIRRGRRAS